MANSDVTGALHANSQRVEALPPWAQRTYAAACLQRLEPFQRQFVLAHPQWRGLAEADDGALEFVWSRCAAGQPLRTEAADLVRERIRQATPRNEHGMMMPLVEDDGFAVEMLSGGLFLLLNPLSQPEFLSYLGPGHSVCDTMIDHWRRARGTVARGAGMVAEWNNPGSLQEIEVQLRHLDLLESQPFSPTLVERLREDSIIEGEVLLATTESWTSEH